ncbi:multidrug resistance protein fnx1 [Pyrenophora tritici-repentis]|uniref:MFS-1 multi-domain protein n=1 Tax=Pyrenophora tritici-repentis TaxID=45151 RepID=A0A2W1G6B2_9PLEO|nr:MFS-1 multi-domain protein [Pyrenophora tritici-repentis]KAF7442332.1 MFS-1 multi-domain protein [Pyrenophora tritici-repentis]KAF7579294.1 MFS-1 multi-domain protein [Pyrenophora tritici-repentis]KAG9378223.1 MFS-1 multi-domain protein [Pyrenophora tritici-repentis]KAI0580911.1 MFS-1 multi-domain protein [Pyrenophora tritici-repentis]
MPSPASERTPLLRASSQDDQNGSSINADEVRAAEVAQQGEGAAPQFPETGKSKSYSNGQSILSDEDAATTQDEQKLVRFQKNGKLEGVGVWKFRCVFGGIVLGYFIAMFDSTLMASSHPVITSYFHASNSASWLSTAFLLTSTSLQPLMGRLSDTFGRRPLYIAGLMFLAATTAWCALAQSIGSFIAARAFCGIGAAGVLSMGNIMTNDLVSIEVRGTYQAYINLFYGGGSACGAAFGGFLCDKLGWRMTFAIQIPVLIMLLINAIFTTPSTLGPNLAKSAGLGIRDAMKGFDVAGSFLLTVSVAFLILGLNVGGNIYPWTHWVVITSLLVALVTCGILIKVESKAERPVMPLPMLFSKPRGNLVFNNFFAQIGMNTILFNAPLYFQAVELESASVSGFRLAGPSVALTICGVSAGFIMTATGRMKWLIVVGSLAMLLGATCMSLMWDGIPKWLATVFLVPSSIGQGLSFPATSLAVLATSTQEDQAVMSSTLILWRSLGIVMGVSISSLILQNALKMNLEKLVTGHNKAKITHRVRKSVHSIIDLDPKHQSQVIQAYSQSLRLVFISAIIMFVVVNVLVFTIDLPHLKKKGVSEEEGNDDEE